MPDILHRLTIDAPPTRVHELVATTDGIARWWTGRPLDGSAGPGGRFGVYFGDAPAPAAVFETVADGPDAVTWRVLEGPDSWVGTRITFEIRPHHEDGTTLLFSHSGWRVADEFMSGCSTNWASYLTSLKSGAEGGAFAAYPAGETSRWD